MNGTSVLLVSFYFSFSSSALICNLLFITILVHSKKLMQSPFFRMSLTLSLADTLQHLLFICYCCPTSLLGTKIIGDLADPLCGMLGNIAWFVSTATLLIQAFNRFISMKYPTIVETVFTKRNCILLTLSSWMVGTSMSLMNIFPAGYLLWDIYAIAWIYNSPIYGFIDMGYTCSVLFLVFILHISVFANIIKRDRSLQNTARSERIRRRREIRQFVQFFVITLFPVIYEVVGNLMPQFVIDSFGIDILNICNNVAFMLATSANGFTYIFFNETVKEELLDLFRTRKSVPGSTKVSTISSAIVAFRSPVNTQRALQTKSIW